jgi:hypothetical protein
VKGPPLRQRRNQRTGPAPRRGRSNSPSERRRPAEPAIKSILGVVSLVPQPFPPPTWWELPTTRLRGSTPQRLRRSPTRAGFPGGSQNQIRRRRGVRGTGSATEITPVARVRPMRRPPILGCDRTEQRGRATPLARRCPCCADDASFRARRTTRVFHVERSQCASTRQRVGRSPTITRLKRSTTEPNRASEAINDRSPVLQRSRRPRESAGNESVRSVLSSAAPTELGFGWRAATVTGSSAPASQPGRTVFPLASMCHVLGLGLPCWKHIQHELSKQPSNEKRPTRSKPRPHQPTGDRKPFNGSKRRRPGRRSARTPATPRRLVRCRGD